MKYDLVHKETALSTGNGTSINNTIQAVQEAHLSEFTTWLWILLGLILKMHGSILWGNAFPTYLPVSLGEAMKAKIQTVYESALQMVTNTSFSSLEQLWKGFGWLFSTFHHTCKIMKSRKGRKWRQYSKKVTDTIFIWFHCMYFP